LAPASSNETGQVVSYEEMRRTVGANDSFASLSKEIYHDESYAKALQMWNQNHPRATEAMARDGTLAPGDKIFIPPATQLEQHYAGLIPNLKPPPRPAGTIPVSFTAPATATSDIAYYKVVKDESIEGIARTTLGSSDRTNDLLRLNPNFRTGQNVSAGTLLVMPPGARVPAENAASR
jgi:hypothetical protein